MLAMKRLISFLLILFVSFTCYGREIITGAENDEGNTFLTEEGIEILNEELRQQDDGIKDNATDIATNTPSGIIVMWSGAISAIPSGWVICDGNNGTPDLTDRFVIHADDDSGGTNDVGDTGGSRTISEANLPSHVHSFVTKSGTGISTGIYHNLGDTDGMPVGNYTLSDPSQNTDSVGSGTNYMPKYYALAYIMKT